jgi:hypothetical protein
MLTLNKSITTDCGAVVVYVWMATKRTLPKSELEFNENLSYGKCPEVKILGCKLK